MEKGFNIFSGKPLCSYKELYTVLAFLIIGASMVSKYSFDNNFFPTCNYYVFNTYLHLLLGLSIIGIFVCLFPKREIISLLTSINSFAYIVIGVISIGLLTALLNWIPSHQVILKYLFWLIYLAFVSLLLYPTAIYGKSMETLHSSILLTFGILSVLSIIAFKSPETLTKNWRTGLFLMLVAVIIVELFGYFTGYFSVSTQKMISIAVIVLFCAYILYDTQKIITNSSNCKLADYIGESTELLLNFINILVRMVSLHRNDDN